MSLAKGRFGVEYDPRRRRDGSSGPGWVVFVAVAAAAVSLCVTLVKRARPAAEPDIAIATQPEAPATRPAEAVIAQPAPVTAVTPPPPSVTTGLTTGRPSRVKNLLLRLEEAEKTGNIPMAVTTIETLRALPGEPVADLDDQLARRLGDLNERWLFELGGKQWVEEVTVRPGESASRIASSHGSTLASLVRLNTQIKDPNQLRAGVKVKVMNHPRLSLTIHKRARFADLHLNGKFFRRYDITEEVEGKVGVYKVEQAPRALFKTLGLAFSLRDRVALETILPKGATVIISET